MTVAVDVKEVGSLLTGLVGREITATMADRVEAHPDTLRGMVTNEDELVAVIGGDLAFAHRAAAALAMMPVGRCDDAGDQPDADLLEIYHEVSNVISRLVDEATPMRVRLDPGIDHDQEAMEAIVASGSPIVACQTLIDGYGSGRFAVWLRD